MSGDAEEFHPATPPDAAAVAVMPAVAATVALASGRPRWAVLSRYLDPARLRPRAELVARFLLGQISVQGLNILAGFLLLRMLDVTSYAQFNVALAFQTTLGMLIDLGFANSIVGLVGPRADDRLVVGTFIRSALFFRRRTCLIAAAAAVVIYPLMVSRQGWPIATQVGLMSAVLASLALQTLVMYSSALLIGRRLTSYYGAQIVGAVAKLAAFALLLALGLLSSTAAAWVSALALGLTGWFYYRAASDLATIPRKADPQANREMLRYMMPLIPGVVFIAFQGHIAVALAAIFGREQNIAEVGALGRLGQVFAVLSAVNPVLIEPYVARAARERLGITFARVIGSQSLLAAAVAAFGVLAPAPLLWFLGPTYRGLRWEASLVVLTWSVSHVCAALWAFNSARRWIYWWASGTYFALVISVQTACVILLDLSTTRGVIYLTLVSAIAMVFLHVATAVYGFKYGPPAAKASPTDAGTEGGAKE